MLGGTAGPPVGSKGKAYAGFRAATLTFTSLRVGFSDMTQVPQIKQFLQIYDSKFHWVSYIMTKSNEAGTFDRSERRVRYCYLN